ncbi:unnamed protein product [Urochloa humidicola]
MGNVEQHLGHATSTPLHYQLTDLWGSPRGTVLRIEALALVAIAFSFFLATFGSCRRWSNRWIVQKGFLAAQVLSLSLGTYSIGLMQSSSVKSEMYPIWAVSLFTLFGCVDPVTSYNGLDYKGPLSKVVFQLFLYYGYVLLMTVSTISGGVGRTAICVLSAISFIKGFHRSLALVLPSRTRGQLGGLVSTEPRALAGHGEGLEVHLPFPQFKIESSKEESGKITKETKWKSRTSMADIHSSCNDMLGKLGLKEVSANAIEDVCLGYSLSHLLRRRFLGLDTGGEMEKKRQEFENLLEERRAIDYKRTLKAIEVELAFLYEIFFTSNEFLHYCEAKMSSFWALASFMGICLVGVAAAIPGAMASRHRITDSAISTGRASRVVIVGTTTADLIITLVILVFLALLQLLQLIRWWTSNWARVSFACEYATTRPRSARVEYKSYTSGSGEGTGFSTQVSEQEVARPSWWWWSWMRLKAFVITRMNWLDDKYLWQDKLGQLSLSAAKDTCGWACLEISECLCSILPPVRWKRICSRFTGILGLQYIGQVLRELLVVRCGGDVKLHDDVKASVADFLGQMKSIRVGKDWSSLFTANGIDQHLSDLPYSNAPPVDKMEGDRGQSVTMSRAFAFAHRVMVWHAATRYCEEHAEQVVAAESRERERNRRVAMDLSRYCAYLVESVPELLPGPPVETKRAFDEAVKWSTGLRFLETEVYYVVESRYRNVPNLGFYWGQRLLDETPDPWEVLARLWVQTLLYAAPYGNVQAHLEHLSQGGEFITHLWALLYHIGIDVWEHEPDATQDTTQGQHRRRRRFFFF